MNIFRDDSYQHIDLLYIRRRKADYEILLTLVRCGWGGQIIQVEEQFTSLQPHRFKTPMLMTHSEMCSGEKEISEYINRKRHERHRTQFYKRKRSQRKDSNP